MTLNAYIKVRTMMSKLHTVWHPCWDSHLPQKSNLFSWKTVKLYKKVLSAKEAVLILSTGSGEKLGSPWGILPRPKATISEASLNETSFNWYESYLQLLTLENTGGTPINYFPLYVIWLNNLVFSVLKYLKKKKKLQVKLQSDSAMKSQDPWKRLSSQMHLA